MLVSSMSPLTWLIFPRMAVLPSWRGTPKLMTGQSVWIRPHKASAAAWKEGRVIAVRKPLFGKCKVRISFLVPFEYETFKQLVYGPDYLSNAPHERSPGT